MTSSHPIKWGILSTARIGVTAFIPSARATPGAQVHAIASRSQATADAFARDHDIPVALGSYQACSTTRTSTPSISRCPTRCTPNGPSKLPRPANTSFAKNP